MMCTSSSRVHPNHACMVKKLIGWQKSVHLSKDLLHCSHRLALRHSSSASR